MLFKQEKITVFIIFLLLSIGLYYLCFNSAFMRYHAAQHKNILLLDAYAKAAQETNENIKVVHDILKLKSNIAFSSSDLLSEKCFTLIRDSLIEIIKIAPDTNHSRQLKISAHGNYFSLLTLLKKITAAHIPIHISQLQINDKGKLDFTLSQDTIKATPNESAT